MDPRQFAGEMVIHNRLGSNVTAHVSRGSIKRRHVAISKFRCSFGDHLPSNLWQRLQQLRPSKISSQDMEALHKSLLDVLIGCH